MCSKYCVLATCIILFCQSSLQAVQRNGLVTLSLFDRQDTDTGRQLTLRVQIDRDLETGQARVTMPGQLDHLEPLYCITDEICFGDTWEFDVDSLDDANSLISGEWAIRILGRIPSDEEELHTLVVEPISLEQGSLSKGMISSFQDGQDIRNGAVYPAAWEFPDGDPPFGSYLEVTADYGDVSKTGGIFETAESFGITRSGSVRRNFGDRWFEMNYEGLREDNGSEWNWTTAIASSEREIPLPLSMSIFSVTEAGSFQADFLGSGEQEYSVEAFARYYFEGENIGLTLVPEPTGSMIFMLAGVALLLQVGEFRASDRR